MLVLIGAWLFARQFARPISALIRSADRIGEGDYTRPFDVARRDELGELQLALERMRQKLSETTITKNYLDTVLNSLSDAVIVTSPDGIIKSCNEATQGLLGYSDADLWASLSTASSTRRIAAPLTWKARAQGPRDRATHRVRQTIPVSMASSGIASLDPQFEGNIHVARNITDRSAPSGAYAISRAMTP